MEPCVPHEDLIIYLRSVCVPAAAVGCAMGCSPSAVSSCLLCLLVLLEALCLFAHVRSTCMHSGVF